MNKSYRIHTIVGEDTVLKVDLKQDFDFLEILSLKINQEDTYRYSSSNYGVIVGRVLANDAFGIPNAKISVFIPLSDNDYENTELRAIYNYTTTTSTNGQNIRYNLLPDSSTDDCYRVIGTFPNKRLVLDDNTILEVFDKYYKYTTVTNNAGDYMIYGVPTGNTQLHVDIDLSDIGVLSQKPRDLMYKGYNETLFDNPEQFKEGTNLDNMAQVISQNQNLYVYPFYSDEDSDDVGITRCDIQVQYKFEPTCVFFGSVISDSNDNNIQPTCTPNSKIGQNRELICGGGTIEMIRYTIDDRIEEFPILGNQLIDSDGVWCYQIPMNLDYVGMDEYGNIVATDNPNKGIPTRTRVRFRFSMDNSDTDSMSRHRAKYLVPNNPQIVETENMPYIQECSEFEKHYEFGSSTKEDDFRDLYWNKVYSVKNYIPRLQTIKKIRTRNYVGLRSINYHQNQNPFPFNKVRFHMPFMFRMLCIAIKVLIWLISFLNILLCVIVETLLCITIPTPFGKIKFCPLKPLKKYLRCISFGGGLTDSDTNNTAYYPGCFCENYGSCPDGMEGCTQSTNMKNLYDIVEQALAQDYEVVNLDFYNDWVNGTLYFPLWHWKKTRKRSFFFGLFRRRAKNQFCDCDKWWSRLRLMDSCTMNYNGAANDKGSSWHHHKKEYYTKWGVIKNKVNKDGLNLYYYAPGVIIDEKPNENSKNGSPKPFARYFATDIILLGTFNSCDSEGLPQLYKNLPSTTSNIPLLTRTVIPEVDEEIDSTEGTDEEVGSIEVTGMDWLHDPEKSGAIQIAVYFLGGKLDPMYKDGILMGIDCTAVSTKPKSCVNISRLSELGVNYDMSYDEVYSNNGSTASTHIEADGIINKVEIDDYESRAMFATLNHRGLTKFKVDKSTGYNVYDFRYVYPVDFDGRHNNDILRRYRTEQKDIPDEDYLLFRFGPDWEHDRNGNPTTKREDRITHNYTGIGKPSTFREENFFPYYNNSFFFYFGLNEGKTSIDKLRQKFDATCTKKVKYPFTVDTSTVIPKWCMYTDGELDPRRSGVIEVDLPNIKTPYSYTLFTQDSDVIIRETNMKLQKLIIGVKLSDNETYEKPTGSTEGDEYYQSSDGTFYIKDGKVHSFKDSRNVVKKVDSILSNSSYYVDIDNGENTFYFPNGTYRLIITDVNGKNETININLNQQPLNATFDIDKLGTKFLPQTNSEETEDDYTTFDEIYEEGNYGEINIDTIYIDGDQYTITKAIFVAAHYGSGDSKSYEEYLLTVQGVEYNSGQTYDLQMKLYVNELEYPNDIRLAPKSSDTFVTLACQTSLPSNGADLSVERPTYVTSLGTSVDVAKFEDNKLSFYPCIPGKYLIVLTQYCNGELNDNVSSNVVQIKNGELLDVFVNEVPFRMINYDDGNFWYKTENPDEYLFPNINEGKALWSEYVNYTTNVSEDGVTEYADEKTRLNALLFKFNSIFRLSDATKFTDNGNNTFEFLVNGGKNVVSQVYYPTYNEFGELFFKETMNVSQAVDIYKSKLSKWTLDTNPSVSCDASHPNIISYNYKAYFYSSDANKGLMTVNPSYRYYLPSDDISAEPSGEGDTNTNKTDLMPFTTLLRSADGYDTPSGLNPLFGGLYESSINYFATFTNNAGLDGTKYESVPPNSTPVVHNDEIYSFEAQTIPPTNYSENIENWMKFFFVDYRMGFRGVLMTSTPSLAKFTDENDVVLRGRFTLQTIGGIEMAYDINKNVIQKLDEFDDFELEYGYYSSSITASDSDVTIIHNNTEKAHKCFYQLLLGTNKGKYDLTMAMVNQTLPLTKEEELYDFEESTDPVGISEVANYGIFDENGNIVSDYIDGYDGWSVYEGVGMNKNIENCKGYYNGYDEYPIKRFTDIIGVDITDNFTLDIASASYDINPTIEYDDNDPSYSAETINGVTTSADEINLSISCGSIYEKAEKSIASCIDGGNFDVFYSANTNATTSSMITCTPKLGRFTISYGEDNGFDSATYSYTTYRPFFLRFNNIEEMVNAIRDIKTKSRNDEYSPYDTYEYVLREYASNIIKLEAVETEEAEDAIWGLDETSDKYYKNLYENNDLQKSLVYQNNMIEIPMVVLYLQSNASLPLEYQNIWGYGKDAAYTNRRGFDISSLNNGCLLLFGGREYFQNNEDCMLERDLRVFDFGKAYTFQNFTLSEFSAITCNKDEETNMYDFDYQFKISGISISDMNLEIGCKVWNFVATIEEQDLSPSYAIPISDTEAIVHVKGFFVNSGTQVNLQFFVKNNDGLIFGTSFMIDVKVNE